MTRISRLNFWVLTVGGAVVCAALCSAVTAYFIAPFGWQVMRVSLALALGLPLGLGLPIFAFLAIKLRELSESNDRLLRLNRLDALTGVLNRATFTAEAEGVLADRDARSGVLLIIDVDHFKQINDCHGHRAGDEALVAIGRSLEAAVEGRSALVGRLGGEEFGILLPCLRADMATLVGEHVRLAIETMARPASLEAHPITVSVGACAFTTPSDFARVFNRADEALYASKRNGRNRVTLAAGMCRTDTRGQEPRPRFAQVR